MKSASLTIGIAIVAYVLGVAVGQYRLPPFNQIRILKHQLPFAPALDSWIARLRYSNASADVIMLGDSITAGGDWAGRFPGASILNLGIGGDTSAGVLARIDDVIRRKPRAVLMMIGVNDLLQDIPPELVEANIQLVASRLAMNHIKPIVQSTLLVEASRFKANEKIMSVNEQLRDWCAKQGIVFVDVNTALSFGGSLLTSVTSDGLHLNEQGYALWSGLIRPYVQDAVK
jgi:lysophospholipase L1-like esterase